MPDRDPRIDPRPGDVVYGASDGLPPVRMIAPADLAHRRRGLAVFAGPSLVAVQAQETRFRRQKIGTYWWMTKAAWRRWARGGEVLTRGDDPGRTE